MRRVPGHSSPDRVVIEKIGGIVAREKKPRLPTAGDAFAFPLGNGMFSACRVLLDETSEPAKSLRQPAIYMVGSSWMGERLPAADDPVLRPILYLTHHLWKGEPNALWVSDEPSSQLILIGKIEPTTEEQASPVMRFGFYESIIIQPLIQWRWDNDRDALLAEDAIEQKASYERTLAAQGRQREYLSRVTLDELRGRRFFSGWSIPPAEATRASRTILTNTIDQLLELGSDAPEEERLAILRRCIESFNELNAEFVGFIETVEREDICGEFEAIVHACGLGSYEDLADRWRQW
jgi:hypothetical protein